MIRDMADLTQAVRSACAAAGIPAAAIDSYLRPNCGPVPIFPILEWLGLALVVAEDPEQIERVRHRWVKRKRPQRLPGALIAPVKPG
jgi:hypothetical protein